MEPSHTAHPAPGTAAAGREPLVVVKNVNKHYGDLHVLKNISTTINRGEVVVVIGPSGSGKSTFCRALNRLEEIKTYRGDLNRTIDRWRALNGDVPILDHRLSPTTGPML